MSLTIQVFAHVTDFLSADCEADLAEISYSGKPRLTRTAKRRFAVAVRGPFDRAFLSSFLSHRENY